MTDRDAWLQPLAAEDFRAELCEQLGLRPLGLEDTPATTECAGCGGSLGSLGQHVTSCPSHGTTTLVHNAVVTTVVRSINTLSEYSASAPNHAVGVALATDELDVEAHDDVGSRKRPDVLVTGGPLGLGAASASLDVQIVRVASPSYAARAVREAANAATVRPVAPDVEHILQKRERVKIDRYYGLTAPTRDAILAIAPGALFRSGDDSPNLLIQIARRPSSAAGAMSWNRLPATCTWRARSAVVRA